MNVTFITIIKSEQDDGNVQHLRWIILILTPFPKLKSSLDKSHLIKGDLFIIPVLNVEKEDYMAMFVSAREDPWVTSFNGAAYSLWA